MPSPEKPSFIFITAFLSAGYLRFSYAGAPQNDSLQLWIEQNLSTQLKIVAENLSAETFFEKFEQMEGIVEIFVEGEIKTSPSVQCRITPVGTIDILSTHDQDLGGEYGQIFLGASFPANEEYAVALGESGKKVSEELRKYGVLGRFGVDFMSVNENGDWKHYAIEINLRKGGTTHPYLMLQFLTDGDYNAEDGHFYMHEHKKRFYFATDNLQRDCYKGLTPHDLIDIAMCHGLHYNGATEEGVMFHLISTLSQYGKVGLVAIGSTPQRAKEYYYKVVEVLDRECEAC